MAFKGVAEYQPLSWKRRQPKDSFPISQSQTVQSRYSQRSALVLSLELLCIIPSSKFEPQPQLRTNNYLEVYLFLNTKNYSDKSRFPVLCNKILSLESYFMARVTWTRTSISQPSFYQSIY